jgi:hypothetical protein
MPEVSQKPSLDQNIQHPNNTETLVSRYLNLFRKELRLPLLQLPIFCEDSRQKRYAAVLSILYVCGDYPQLGPKMGCALWPELFSAYPNQMHAKLSHIVTKGWITRDKDQQGVYRVNENGRQYLKNNGILHGAIGDRLEALKNTLKTMGGVLDTVINRDEMVETADQQTKQITTNAAETPNNSYIQISDSTKKEFKQKVDVEIVKGSSTKARVIEIIQELGIESDPEIFLTAAIAQGVLYRYSIERLNGKVIAPDIFYLGRAPKKPRKVNF